MRINAEEKEARSQGFRKKLDQDFHGSTLTTDLANSRRFTDGTDGLVRYVPAWKKWLVWDSKRWRIDDDGQVWRLAREVVREILYEAATAERKEDVEAIGKWALESHNQKRLRAMLDLAQSELEIPVDANLLDKGKMLLNVKNGTIDLVSGKLQQHNEADLITKLTNIDFDEEAKAPKFEKFVCEILGGNEDLVGFLQRAVGYTLTGETIERILLILHGPGRNGKSTLLEILRALLGDFAMKASVQTLLQKRTGGIPNDIARLKGARFVYCSEANEGARIDEGLVKELTGKEQITARFLRAEFFEFLPEFKLWIGTNHRPEIGGTDDAIWDRIRLIPFEVRFEGPSEKKTLLQELREELPGILNWAVAGCLEWQERGLAEPEKVIYATHEYRVEMDFLAEFLNAKCLLGPSYRVGATELFKEFVTWAKEGEEKALTQRAFSARLIERGYRKNRSGSNGRYRWLGLALRSNEEDTEQLNSTEGFSQVTPSEDTEGATMEMGSVSFSSSVREPGEEGDA